MDFPIWILSRKIVTGLVFIVECTCYVYILVSLLDICYTLNILNSIMSIKCNILEYFFFIQNKNGL